MPTVIDPPPTIPHLLLHLLGRTGFFTLGLGAILFGAGGTFAWPGAWVFVAEMGGLSLASGLFLARHDPALLAERLRPPVRRDQPPWDQAMMIGLGIGFCAWLVLMSHDAARFGFSHVPIWAHALGAAGVLASVAIGLWTLASNPFAAPIVMIQDDHRVISSGPYALVRHPMYAGALPFFVGTPLLLGSWWGLALVPSFVLGMAARITMEERTLRRGLDGYAAYAARVRWRLLPFVW